MQMLWFMRKARGKVEFSCAKPNNSTFHTGNFHHTSPTVLQNISLNQNKCASLFSKCPCGTLLTESPCIEGRDGGGFALETPQAQPRVNPFHQIACSAPSFEGSNSNISTMKTVSQWPRQ